jgi:hypothetical protein
MRPPFVVALEIDVIRVAKAVGEDAQELASAPERALRKRRSTGNASGPIGNGVEHGGAMR